ncbi:ATP-binding protein [Mycobacterium deserti]|uniref:ATP-binding protein n=1 Tax=Mycobacterium deserti TaxID=2978347 RepID=A0ABT2MJP6_9MYCO|nr:ATP-binding protein [Mycobacterium deserti]MCT7661645.1 ATP-binding protein [Mycobacterium deserti]
MGIDACPLPADSLRIEVPATADRLADVRRRLSTWLEQVGVSGTGAADIVLAVNEACTNCVEHAYRDIDTGVIQVEAAVEDGRISVCIADFGLWRTPSPEPTTRGRGLLIIDAMSDDVRMAHDTSGTTVRISFDLGSNDFRAAAAERPGRKTHRSDAQRS